MKRFLLLLILCSTQLVHGQVSTTAMKDTVNRYFQIPYKNPNPRVQEQATAIRSIIDWIMQWLDTKQDLLPSQTGHSGKYLTTNGSALSWGTVSALSGSGTTNYLAKWTGSLTFGNSQIFDNGTFIGINTNIDPGGVVLRANGAAQIDGNMRVSDGTRYMDIGLPGGSPTIAFRRHSDNALQTAFINALVLNVPGSVSAGYVAPGTLNSVYYGERAFTTSGGHLLDIRGSFTASSGTGEFNSLHLYPSINQTGSATGQTRGIWIRTALTSTTVPYRAIQWDNSSGWGLYGNSTANNYLGGKLLIGSTTDITNTLFSVNSTTKTSMPYPRMTQAQRTAISMSSADYGAHVYQLDGTEGVYVYKSTGWSFAY